MGATRRRVGRVGDRTRREDVGARCRILGFAQLDAGGLTLTTTGGDEEAEGEQHCEDTHRSIVPDQGSPPALGPSPYARRMSRASIERRLRAVGEQLRSARDDLAVTEEQLVQLADEAEDARLRALVSETPLAEKEHRKASRHVDRLRKHRERLVAKIATLDAEQDDLLDRFTAS